MRIIGLQSNDISKPQHSISSNHKSAKHNSTAVSSLKSISVPFLVDWTPALENSKLRTCF